MILTFLQITNTYQYSTPPGEKCRLDSIEHDYKQEPIIRAFFMNR